MSYTYILASQSPRRQELLKHLIPTFEIRLKATEEDYPATMLASQVPVFLAEKKARAFSAELKPNELLIAADTVVILEGSILGKPTDKEEAFAMLSQLSGKKHEVITGVCLWKGNQTHFSFSEKTTVYFKPMTAEAIHYYLDHYQPYDKAGAYGVQEWWGMVAIERIEGCFYNVMGLPTARLYEALQVFSAQ
ncbi:MAG: septum formation protein Maf [Cytophagales bacterium]|nr:MAG: septum formation protein Maf [Cytophagales bacterium]